MDLCEQGAADYGLAFGDAASYLAAPRLIARREGWGAELALGARELAALKGRPDLATEVKGLEMPAYDPRGTFGMGLGYATSDRGGCHMRAFSAGDDILGGSGPAHSLKGAPSWSPTCRTSAPSPGRVCGAPTCPWTPTSSAPTSVTSGAARRATRSC